MTAAPRNPWLYIPKPIEGRALRLLCFPHAAGGASFFHSWISVLPPGVELCGIQLPGRETRLNEALATDLLRVVATVADEIEPLLAEPLAMFGHSMGALLAFELAREMRRRRLRAPLYLFTSGRKAPHFGPEQIIWNLPEPEFLHSVTTRYNGIPKAVLDEPDLMRFFLPILRADVRMIDTYTCRNEPPLEIPITMFSGLDDTSVTFAEVAAWRQFTNRAFRLEMLPGGHFYLQQSRDAVVASLRRDLAPFLQNRTPLDR